MLIPIFARLNVFERLIEIDDPQWLVSTSKVLAKITFKVNNCTSIFYFDRKPCCLLAGWTPMKCQFNCGEMNLFVRVSGIAIGNWASTSTFASNLSSIELPNRFVAIVL